MTVPFYNWDEENAEIAIGHEYLIPSIASALAANDRFCVIKQLSSLAYAEYK